MGGLAWSVAQLLGHDLEDGASQAIFVKVGRRGRGGLATHHRFGLRQSELGDLGGQLRHDVLGLLGADAGQAPEVGLVLTGDGGGDLRDRRGQRSGRNERADVLDGDELLEELLVEPGQEADQHRRRLILCGVVVDLQRHLCRAVSVARQRAGDGMLDHRGQHDLVADARCLDHHAVLVLPAQSSAEQRDHLVTGAPKWPPYSPNTGAPKWPPYSPNTGAPKWPPYSPMFANLTRIIWRPAPVE